MRPTPKLRIHRPHGRLSFNQKRYVAKEIISGKASKNIADDWHISQASVSQIRKHFVVTTMAERYPDGYDTQGELPLATEKPVEVDKT